LSNFVSAQNHYKEIDSLLDASTLEYDNFESQKSIDLARIALKKAEKIKLSQAVAEANYNIARGLSDIGKQEESFKFIESAEKEEFAKKNILFRAKLKEVSAMNYMTLGMYPQAVKEFHKALVLLKKEKSDSLANIIRGRVFGNLFVTYNDTGNLDSAHYYLDKEIKSLKTLNEKNVYAHLSLSYLDYGLDCLEEKNDLDSARFYFEKSLNLLEKYDNPFKQDAYRALGDLYYKKKEFAKSLDYYLKSKKIIEELDFSDASYTYIYKRISQLYKDQNNEKLAQLYLDKYIELKDSLSESKIGAVGDVVNHLLKKQERLEAENRKKIYLMIFLGVFISLFIILLIFKIYRRNQTQKKQALVENEKLLIKKEKENKLLKQQLNEAFEEVAQLARENSPCFLSRFSEVYPEFLKKIEEINPSLQSSELAFCAMLYLNFSTKDVAEYTYVTPKAVQNRKNRLRKKLNILSEEDINVWMQKLTD